MDLSVTFEATPRFTAPDSRLARTVKRHRLSVCLLVLSVKSDH
jgi:hypothetical protein